MEVKMNNVIWKPLDGWEKTHVISSEGVIKKFPYIDTLGRYWGERTIKPFKNRNGYLVAYLDYHGKTERTSVHRLVARTFIPNPLNLPQVNHKDEDKTNNNVSNLECATKVIIKNMEQQEQEPYKLAIQKDIEMLKNL